MVRRVRSPKVFIFVAGESFEVEQQIEKLELRMPVIGFCTRLSAGSGLLSLGAVFS